MKYSDTTIFNLPTNTQIPATASPIRRRFYCGDWKYLHIAVQGSGNPSGAILLLRCYWYLNVPAFDLQQEDIFILGMSTAPTTYYAYWCIPVRGSWLDMAINNQNATVANMTMTAKFSNVKALGVSKPLINVVAPSGAAGVTSTTYATICTIGTISVSGYIFNDTAGGAGIWVLDELDEAGVWQRLFYMQTPVGSAAQSVIPFNVQLPHNGRSIRAVMTRSGAGLMNGYMNVRTYMAGES